MISLLITSALFAAPTQQPGPIEVVPAQIQLAGPRGSHRLIVEEQLPGGFHADATERTHFKTDAPNVVRVESDGTVVAVGNGEANVVASLGDSTATAHVVVKDIEHGDSLNFRNDVLPVLTRLGCNSGACHGAAAGKNGLKLTLRGYGPELDYDVLVRQTQGRRINRSKPEQSLMLLKATGALEHGGGARLVVGSPEYQMVSAWIAAGAPAPDNSDPRVARVEVLPKAVRAKVGARQQLLVLATYTDGTRRDVTRLTKFDSADAGVAKVDEDGIVTVTGQGEGAVSVWFSSMVDLAIVTSPYDFKDAAPFAAAPRQNTIDELNLKKLQALGIPPSPPADDAAFLRRASLNATGTLPSPEAVDAFLADNAPDKRAKLIDSLLNSQEYVDYWAYKWSDVLLVSSKKLSAPAVWSFYRFVRQSVAENVPWDELARRIITAQGSTLSNGAANYFVLHRDPIDLAESTSVAFLGLSLTCARCHNHPMEKWTQDQYYGFANLFARVSLKDGVGANGSVTAGDVVVSASPEGDLAHPRRGIVMAPQPLDAKPLASTDRADRRIALAAWLANPANPYFDKALVNRVWANFFGRGIIDPEDDLRATNPASDPDLLAWLVDDFRTHGRDVKHLIRTVMNSAVYQRSSAALEANAHDTKLHSHYMPKRLTAEVLLDAVDRVTGVPTAYPGYPEGWRSLKLPDSKVENTFLDAFGRPAREAVCSCERSDEPSIAQALNLTNGSVLNDKLRSGKGTIARLFDSKASDAQIIETLYKAALGRPPTDDEARSLADALAKPAAGIDDPEQAKTARRQAVEDLYWAVLTCKEFLFNH